MSGPLYVVGSRAQGFLLPPNMRDWLAPGHLVWVVCEAVERLDFAGFDAASRDDGQSRPACAPRLMATVLLYADTVGERSSRQIERRCQEDIAFRVAAAGLQPDHVTLARSRRRHADALVGLFTCVLALCAEAGLVRLGTVAIDGTRIRANVNKDRVVTPAPVSEEARRLAEQPASSASSVAPQQILERRAATAKARGRRVPRRAAARRIEPTRTAASCAPGRASCRATTPRFPSARRTSSSPAPSRRTSRTTACLSQ